MNKQPRLFPAFVALSFFLASGPFPAAAQMRVRVGAGPSAVVPLAPSGRLPAAMGSVISLAIGPQSLLASPLMSAVPPAAAISERSKAIVVPMPGGAATSIAEEAAAYAEAVSEAATDAPHKGIVARIRGAFLRRPAALVSFDGAARKAPPISARMGLREQEPLTLPNGTATDEQPTVPTADLARTQVYAVSGAPGLTPTSGANRVVLAADPADTDGILRALRARIDGEQAHYGVASAELRLVHAQRFEGRGEQADAIFFYFHRIKDGLVVHGHNVSFTVIIIDGRPQLVAEPDRSLSPVDVNTGTMLTDEEIMGKIAERIGEPVANVSAQFEFYEQKLVYARGAWRNVKLYIGKNLPVMVAVDVISGLVFAWDNRAGLTDFSVAPNAGGVTGRIIGNTVDHGPILANSVISEVPMPFMEVKIGAKSYVTDKNGVLPSDLGLEIGREGLELSATLSGPYVRVENQQGNTLSVKVSVKPGENKVVFNTGTGIEDENTLAQINAFQKVNLSLNFLRERKLTNERMDKIQLPVRTNIDSECNAYYTSGRPTLNFFRSSKNCVNSAYDTVAEHENGHYWDDFTGGIVNGAMSEGWGDILSMFRLNNPIIGEHFRKKARNGVDYIRHGENKYQYNEFDEVHEQGQAWGGFAWKLRKALMAKLGDAEGAAVAESLVLPTMFAKAATIPNAMAQVLVNATGKDGAIRHEAEIRAAAKAHGVNLPQNSTGTGAVESLLSQLTGPLSALRLSGSERRSTEAKLTFTAGALIRGRVVNRLRRYLGEVGAKYELKSYGGWFKTDYLLVIEGRQDEVLRHVVAIERWFESLESR